MAQIEVAVVDRSCNRQLDAHVREGATHQAREVADNFQELARVIADRGAVKVLVQALIGVQVLGAELVTLFCSPMKISWRAARASASLQQHVHAEPEVLEAELGEAFGVGDVQG